MRFTYALSALLGLFLFTSLTQASAPALVPAPPNITASSFILIDYSSSYVLAEQNADHRVEPASLTKLMSAYVVFHEIKRGSVRLDDQVRVSEKAWKMRGSRMFIEVGTSVPVEPLLKGMIIQSGNDATVALAEHVAGSEEAFVSLMNKHARVLGMNSTQFRNSTGWPDAEHFTTARDLSLLSQALIRDFPEYYAWYSIKEFTYNDIRQSNRNRLLWMDDRVDGLKTGHTDSAGYCLITSAKDNDMRLIAVVLGTASENARAVSSRKLINHGFRFYETFLQQPENSKLTEMRVWKGDEETVDLGLSKPLYVTAPRGARNRIKVKMQVEAMIEAPVTQNQVYGSLQVMLDDTVLTQQPLVALKSVEEGGIWRKLVDNIVLLFQ